MRFERSAAPVVVATDTVEHVIDMRTATAYMLRMFFRCEHSEKIGTVSLLSCMCYVVRTDGATVVVLASLEAERRLGDLLCCEE